MGGDLPSVREEHVGPLRDVDARTRGVVTGFPEDDEFEVEARAFVDFSWLEGDPGLGPVGIGVPGDEDLEGLFGAIVNGDELLGHLEGRRGG